MTLKEIILEQLEYAYNEGQLSTDPQYRWSKKEIIDYALEHLVKNLSKEGYGKMISCPNYGNGCVDKFGCEKKYDCCFDDLPCDEEGRMFEIISDKDLK